MSRKKPNWCLLLSKSLCKIWNAIHAVTSSVPLAMKLSSNPPLYTSIQITNCREASTIKRKSIQLACLAIFMPCKNKSNHPLLQLFFKLKCIIIAPVRIPYSKNTKYLVTQALTSSLDGDESRSS